ncbi:MAG: hypothetical protein RIR26_1880 [Pseudomonadota bacterium]|jgi:hypothetical protein
MSAASLVPFALFLLNETTRDLYVFPQEAASQIESARPCASMKANVTLTEFTSASLDQMCASLGQSLLPKVNAVVKTQWSLEHAGVIGGLVRVFAGLPTVRKDGSVWPPEMPYTMTGLSVPNGISAVVGVKVSEKGIALLERVDLWSQVDNRFLRTYWSRSTQDPTGTWPVSRILQRVGNGFQRSWKSQPAGPLRPETVRVLVDKRMSERELTAFEGIVKGMTKGNSESVLVPVAVRGDGIVYQTPIPRAKNQELADRVTKELPVYRSQVLSEGPAEVSLMLAAPR